MNNKLAMYLGLWVGTVPPVLLLVVFAYGGVALGLPTWVMVIGLIIVVHLMFGWVVLSVRWIEKWQGINRK